MKTWEDAVRYCIQSSELSKLANDAYFGDPVKAARRYRSSLEFKAIKNLLPSEPMRALDLGAGNGILSWALAMEGWQVTAIEPDPSNLVGAGAIRALAASTNVQITVIEAVGEEVPLETADFDLVIARQVLHHAHDMPAFCREMARLCSHRGTILTLRDHVISGPSQLPDFFEKHPLHHIYGGENAFSLAQYRKAFQDAGLLIALEMRSFDSVINYDPMTPEEIRQKIAANAGTLAPVARAVLRVLPFRVICRLATLMDRRPGRLVSFLAHKQEGS